MEALGERLDQIVNPLMSQTRVIQGKVINRLPDLPPQLALAVGWSRSRSARREAALSAKSNNCFITAFNEPPQ
jgi:hypothetical protein